MPTSPTVLVLVAIGLGVPALVMFLARLFPAAAISIRLLRLRLGDRRARHMDMVRAAAYHHQLPAEERIDALDDRTWQDLDLDEVFLSLDHTRSEPGRQYLYHLLRTPRATPEPLERLERAAQRLAGDDAVTERLRTSLGKLDDPRAGQLVHLFGGQLPRRPRFWWIFPLLSAGSFACLALIAVWPRALVVWLGICLVNVCVQLVYKPRVRRFVPALHQLPGFVRLARTLGALDIAEVAEEIRCLRQGAGRLSVLRRATSWLMFEPSEASSDVVASIYEYVNLLFLFDVNAFVFSVERLRASRVLMREMFDAIGYLDVVQSVAGWRATLPRWTTPEFTDAQKALHVEALVHPLLSHPVPNSLDVDDASVLITGSNMSGKTTFVRAMGVSAVLAQTVHTVCADAWRAPMLRVRTSIGRADSIMEGKSYYLAEAESVRELVRAKESGRQHLFLLDEIFRGTNTTERVAAGRAVLAFLNRGVDLVLVATHDIEVIELLDGAYDAHHFREQIVGGAMTFDYRIYPGPSSTRNAIAMLELLEYPEDLVADALATIDWQSTRATLPMP